MKYQLTLTLDIQKDFENFEAAQAFFDEKFLTKVSQSRMWNSGTLPDISGNIMEVEELIVTI
ncbi:hypothetical protein HW132_28655 [Brasilonema sp. CT11]|nr:hypothetical protein [Brasilonema sp. CT11]